MGRSWKSLEFCRIWLHALGSEHCAIEGNLRLSDLTLSTAEDNAMLMGCLHGLQEVSVMLLGGTAIDVLIIISGNYAG